MRQDGNIAEFLAELHRRPDSDFRPADYGPHSIAVFSSGKSGDDERAHLAIARNANRYMASHTAAGKALREMTDLPREQRNLFQQLVQSRTAMAARGQVEIYGMEAKPDSDFFKYVASPLLSREAVTHINKVPAHALVETDSREQALTFRASEFVRDREEGTLRDINDAAKHYAGGRGAPTSKPRPSDERKPDPVVARVAHLDRERKNDELRREAVRRQEQRRERQQRQKQQDRERGKSPGGFDER